MSITVLVANKINDVFFDISRHTITSDIIEHGHDYVEIVIVTGGRAEHVIDGKPFKAYPGNVCIFPIGTVHSIRNPRNLELYNITCAPEIITKLGVELALLHNIENLIAGKNAEQFQLSGTILTDSITLLNKMHDLYYDLQAPDRAVQFQISFILLLGLLSLGHKNIASPQNMLLDSMRYIAENCTDDLELEELAKQCYMSKRNFIRRFKEKFGSTPIHFQLTCRMQKASELLEKTDMRLEKIAENCGFFDVSHFYKAFSKHFGMPPGKFRSE